MSLVGGGHMDGNTPTHPMQLQEQKVRPHCNEQWSRAGLRRLLYLTASHTTAGSLSPTRILDQAFNVQTLFALMFQWTLILHQIRVQRNALRSVLEE